MEKLKKITLTMIASKMNTAEIEELAECFTQLDKNGDGSLTLEEIKLGIKKSKRKLAKINDIFDSIDTDQNDKIDYTEFIAVTMEKATYL